MLHVVGRVQKGRLIVDEPTDLVEGSVIELISTDAPSAPGDVDEERLAREIAISRRELRQGQGIPASEVVARIRARA